MQEHIKDDYYERIKKAVDFIEENLTEKLTIEMISEKAYFSKYHFIRVFTATTGETVGNYLRRRRISRSSKQLINTSRSILDIAFNYQFESQEAYTRSFKKVYNTSPGRYRKLNNNQIAYGRAKLTIERLNHLKSNVTMKPRIVEVEKKKFNNEAKQAKFKKSVKSGECQNKDGVTVYFSNRCPFSEYHVTNSLVETVKNRNLNLEVVKFESLEEAQNSPTPATIFSLFYNGKFVTTDISACMDSRFDKIIEKAIGK